MFKKKRSHKFTKGLKSESPCRKHWGPQKGKIHSTWGCKFTLIEEFKLEDEKYNTEWGGGWGRSFPRKDKTKGVDIGKYTMSLENSK